MTEFIGAALIALVGTLLAHALLRLRRGDRRVRTSPQALVTNAMTMSFIFFVFGVLGGRTWTSSLLISLIAGGIFLLLQVVALRIHPPTDLR
jgi:hypothetical protein